MKILLVYPIFPDTYWSFKYALSFENKRASFPPLGLLTVSSMLPASWKKRLVDMNVQDLQDGDLEWADMVFVSAMIVQQDSLMEVIARSKAFGKKVAVGGPYVSTSAEKVSHADHIFIGEAETTLPEFLHDLEIGAAKQTYEAGEKPSLHNTPVPDFGLVDYRQYSAMNVQYSRGCPFNCEFCDIIEIYGRVPRTKTNDQMINELDALKATGWRGLVFIVDDNFIGNKKNVKLFMPDLVNWVNENDHPFSFITEASVNLAEDEILLKMMQDADFRRVFLGIETPVEESLKEAQKGQNTRRGLLESIGRIQSFGMEIMAGFIVGFDSDPINIFERQIKFIQESSIPLAMVGLLTALPDTQLWKRLEKEGRLVEDSTGNNTDCSLNFEPVMDRTVLIEGYKSILRRIYNSKNYYQRALGCISHMNQERSVARQGGWLGDLKTFMKIVFTLGLRDSERLQFWRYLYKTLTLYPKNFAHAMTLAAMGYHFRKITAIYCGPENALAENSTA
jgi:radical SAM superfamily enzyme YgiQ (UPF0313 family)